MSANLKQRNKPSGEKGHRQGGGSRLQELTAATRGG
jgi:hypothetical protein